MKLKQWVVVTLLAVGAMSVQAAAVAPGEDLGTLTAEPEYFGAMFDGGYFFDSFDFTLADPGNVLGGVAAFFGDVSFEAVRLGGAPTILTPTATGYSFLFTWLDAGDHTLSIEGHAPRGFAAYMGSVMAQPVPEPHSLVMMLTGIGVMGAVAVRRRQRP